MTDDALARGRASFEDRAWGDAFAQLSAADSSRPLDPADLERLATTAYLVGRDDESYELWARAYHAFAHLHDPRRAARCAFWLAFELFQTGAMAQAGGWLARAEQILDEDDRECAERGLLVAAGAFDRLEAGDAAASLEPFAAAVEIGRRVADHDLVTFASLGRGLALVHAGETAEGKALLDETMIAVTTGETSPIVAGTTYCAVIETCHATFDIERAGEWTDALDRWCGSQPDLHLFRGQCLVYRSEIMRLHGAWPEAMEEAEAARARFSRPPEQPAAGMAFYQLGELHRSRGDFPAAERSYREANRYGRAPYPGLAQLRLAQGRVPDAVAALRRTLDEAPSAVTRAPLLPTQVEAMLSAGDLDSARAAAAELTRIARDVDTSYLRAAADFAGGTVSIAAGDARAAIPPLRRASATWRDLRVPYEAARARVAIALACRALGDEDTATLELEAARAIFEDLGAAPDLEHVRRLASTRPEGAGLTQRELQVLRLVAGGSSNRSIASELVLSERTVERHVSNIFTKLAVTSRAAATAYAYRHHLV